MHILTDIGNSTIVTAIAENDGQITNTWRFKTRKEETFSFFRYELKQGLRKYGLEPKDIETVTISSVVPEVNDDIVLAITDLTGITPISSALKMPSGFSPSISSHRRSWAKTVSLMP